jgi:hypothetical protein
MFCLRLIDTICLLNSIILGLVVVDLLPDAAVFDILFLDLQVATLEDPFPFNLRQESLSLLIADIVQFSFINHV